LIQYITSRLLQTVLVLLGVTALSFGLLFLSGDPAALMAGEDWTREQVEEFRHVMGFDRPVYEQYWDFLSRALRGDFGTSLRQQQPAFRLVMDRMPATAELTLAAILITVTVGVPVGMLAAVKRNTAWDHLAMAFSLLGQSVPVFWLGLMLALIFGLYLGWFPLVGRGTLAHLVMPALTVGLFNVAYTARMTRSGMLEVLAEDYIRTARAKGLGNRVVLYRHAFRNAIIPLVTLVGMTFGSLLGGAVITETIFSWPGVGLLTLQAIYSKDLPVVQASVTVTATIFVLVNLAVDLLYTVLDPRIRLK
jgi:peptide/nickel transport system permease protein